MIKGALALRLGDYLVRRASRHLPAEMRQECCREWSGELPAILDDQDIRFALLRILRMLWYAVDQIRSARQLRKGHPITLINGRRRSALLYMASMDTAFNVWLIISAPPVVVIVYLSHLVEHLA